MPPVYSTDPGRTFSARLAPWISLAAWGLFTAFVVVTTVRLVGVTEDGPRDCLDFAAYYRAGRAVTRGESPYQMDKHGALETFVYAPCYAYFFAPFSRLKYGWACPLWALFNWACVAACVALASQLAARTTPEASAPTRADRYAAWLGTLLISGYILYIIRLGQASALLAALCLGWAVCQRRGRPFAGGLLLAAAVALKMTPLLLAPYLIFRRDWRGLAGAAAGALALFSLPALWLGWQGALGLHLEWLRWCRATQIDWMTFNADNQSLLGLLARLPLISDGFTLYSADCLRALERAYPLIVLGLAGALYGWIFRRRPDRGPLAPEQERLRDNGRLALLFVAMTVFGPRAWPHNFVVLIAPALMLADAALRRPPGWMAGAAALGLVVFACASPKSQGFAPHWSLLRWLHQGRDFWAALAVGGACARTCALQLRGKNGAVRSPASGGQGRPSVAA